jgi:hypothetical protein
MFNVDRSKQKTKGGRSKLRLEHYVGGKEAERSLERVSCRTQ